MQRIPSWTFKALDEFIFAHEGCFVVLSNLGAPSWSNYEDSYGVPPNTAGRADLLIEEGDVE